MHRTSSGQSRALICMKQVRPPGGARREGWVRGGHPDLLRCRPTAAPPAPVVRRETRADSAQTFPLTFTIPAPRRRDACDVRGETGRDTPIEAITDDARGGAAPAAGAAGRPVSVQKYRGELPKTSTVISISSTRLYVLHTRAATPTTHRRTPLRPRPPSSGMCRIPSRTGRRMLI